MTLKVSVGHGNLRPKAASPSAAIAPSALSARAFGVRSFCNSRVFHAVRLHYTPPPQSRRCYVADVTAAMTSALHP